MGFRAASTKDASGSTINITINKPTGTLQGDVMLAFLHVSQNATPWQAVPSGWSQIGSAIAIGNSYAYVFMKVAGASEPASYVWNSNLGSAPNDLAGAILSYSNVAQVSTVDAQSEQSNTSSTSAVAPSETASIANDTLVCAFFSNSQVTATPPSGMTERVDFFSSWSQYVSLEVADVAVSSTGATGTKTATLSAAQANVGWSILLKPGIPLAPTLTAPTNGSYVDMAATPTVSWTHNSGVGATQSGYALRRKISGAGTYEWWNVGTSAWQSTEIFNSTATSSVVFAAGKWTDGNVYNWSVATQDSGGTGPYAADFSVTASAPPSVSSVGPAGTVVTGTPTISWTDTLQSGASQTTYRVVIESGTTATSPGSGTVVWDSGVVSSASTSVTVPSPINNGTVARVFVQVQETGGQASAWGHADFTVTYDTPAQPVLVAVWDSTLARCALTVQGRDNILTANQSSLETDTTGWSATFNCTIARSTAQSVDGSASLAITASAANDCDVASPSTGLAVTAGKAYLAIAAFRAATVARATAIAIEWRDGSGSAVGSTSNSLSVADTTTGWRQAAVVAVAPAGSVYADLVLIVKSAGGAGEVHYVDKIALIPLGDTDHNGYGTNLLDNGDFENGNIDGWYNGGGITSMAASSAHSYTGRQSMAVTASITGDIWPGNGGHHIDVGKTYTVSAWVYQDSGSTQNFQMVCNEAVQHPGAITAVPNATWSRITLTFLASATRDDASIFPMFQAPWVGAGYYIDAVKLEVGSAATPFVPRTYSNLITNPSFETDTSGWLVNGALSVTRSTAYAMVGSASMAVALGTSGATGYGAAYQGLTLVAPIGATLTASAYFYSPTPMNARVTTNGSAGPVVAVPANTWTRATCTFSLQAGDVLYLVTTDSATGQTFYVDAVQVELGNQANPYIDGSLGVGYSWDASENLLSAEAASLEGGTTGSWNALGAALSNSTAQAYDGTHSLLCTTSGTNQGAYQSVSTVGGSVYTFSVWVRSTSAATITLSASENAPTPGGASFTNTTAVAVAANTWTRLVVTGTTPSAETSTNFKVQSNTNANFYIDAVQLEQRDHATPYGSTGGANATTSTRQPSWYLGGFAGTGSYVVEASEDGGTTWKTVRGASAVAVDSAADQTFTVYDYERTPGVKASYRARVTDGTGISAVTSPNSPVVSVTSTISAWWVKDLTNPALNMTLCDAQQNVRNRKGDSAAIYPAGRTNPIVLRGPVHGADGTFRTTVQTEADRTSVLALMTAQDSILIQDPRGRQWYAEWVGDLTESPYQVPQPYYAVQRGWVEVDVPS